ncbi:RNA polymerase I-specific transcription initiation factor RRN6-like protein [Phyllosticta capitalensis]
MTDRSINDLHYGHLGFPSYDVDNHQWNFTRLPGQRKELRPLGEPEISVKDSGAEQVEQDTTSIDVFRNRHFTGWHPDFWMNKDILSRDAQVSRAVGTVSAKYDPLRGDLLAYGKARDTHNKGSRATLNFVALPGGRAGEALRLIRTVQERHGWRSDKSIYVSAPGLDSGDTGWWCGDGAPILQVVAAAPMSEEVETYLAARTARSVHLFRPLFHRKTVPASQVTNSHSSFPPSRMEAKPLVNFTLKPNESAYADFAFNPWYQRQFATLNQEGAWTIWDLEGRQATKYRYKTIPSFSGRLESIEENFEQDEDQHGHYDHWGRIIWVKDVSTVAVCNRRNIVVSDFRGHSARLSASTLRLDKTTWILDIRRDPLDNGRMLVLTASHVLVIQVPNLEDADPEKSTNAVVLLAWRHFRDIEDTTLQITSVAHDEECIILLRSLKDDVVTSVRYTRNEDSDSTLISCSDLTELNVGLKDGYTSTSGPALGIHVLPLEYSSNSRALVSGPGHGYRKHGVQIFRMWFLSAKMEIYKQFGFVWDPEYDQSKSPWKTAPVIESLSWSKKHAHQSSAVVKDNFVVPDGYASDDEFATPPWMNGKRYRRKAKQPLPSEVSDPWTVNNTRVCRNLVDSAKEPAEDITAVASSLRENLTTEPDAETHHNNTLMHLAGPVGVDDIDEASLAFAGLLQSFSSENVEENALKINVLKCAHVQLGQEGQEEAPLLPSISATYENIIQTWLSNLPQDTPARIRLTNERLARQVAAQLCFSATTIRIKEPEPQTEEAEVAGDSQGAGFETPLKSQSQGLAFGSQGFFPSSLPGSQPGSSQSYAHGNFPTPSATPSLVSGTTFSSGVSSLSDGAMSRLRQYTTFSKQQPALNRQMTRMLSHWTPGADPSMYNYSATKRADEHAAAMDDESLTQKDRERLHKKAMRHLKRQRRETAAHLAQSQQAQTPMLVHQQPRSSPGLASAPRPNLMSSQFVSSQATPSQFPSTQVERGTHGGRPKKKVKRRMEGF